MTWDKQNTTKHDVLKVYEEPCVRASWVNNFLFLGQAPLILNHIEPYTHCLNRRVTLNLYLLTCAAATYLILKNGFCYSELDPS